VRKSAKCKFVRLLYKPMVNDQNNKIQVLELSTDFLSSDAFHLTKYSGVNSGNFLSRMEQNFFG